MKKLLYKCMVKIGFYTDMMIHFTVKCVYLREYDNYPVRQYRVKK